MLALTAAITTELGSESEDCHRRLLRERVADLGDSLGIEAEDSGDGVYHYVSVKHLDQHVGDLSGRHNLRDFDAVDRMAQVARGMQGELLRYRDLTA